jgi:hypothetical protein
MKLVLAVVLSLFAVSAHAGTVTLTWTHDAATCADGSPAANCPLSGFEVSEGTSQTAPLAVKENVGPGARSQTWQNVAPGLRCWSLKALAGTGASQVKSDESMRACLTVPLLPPKAPQGITVKIEVTVTTP